MSRRFFRPLLVLAAISALILGVTAALRSGTEGAAAADGEYIVDILPTTFNPPVCQVNRVSSVVRFRNKDTKPRRMIRPNISTEPTAPFLDDTGPIAPGATSTWNIGITTVADYTFMDFDNRSLTVRIVAPISPNAASNCDQLPPTPTPTPTRTPTPVPTPRQAPPACTGLTPISRQPITGCAVAADVARESASETP